MTIQEFLELAEKNGAILTPDEAEKCRRDTIERFSRHQVYTGMFGDMHVIDTHSWGNKVMDFLWTCLICGATVIFVPALIVYFLIFLLFAISVICTLFV